MPTDRSVLAKIYDEPDFRTGQRNAVLMAAAPAMFAALEKIYAGLSSNPPRGEQKHVVGDGVIYRLDGQLMYHAINAARDALAVVRAGFADVPQQSTSLGDSK